MIGAVHAAIGAAVGSLFKKKSGAFAAGVVSHVVADSLPHKDFAPAIEVPMIAASLALIAKWRGTDSPEFWGAVGAVSPDVEHGLLVAGLIRSEHEVFPTHVDDGKLHGRLTDERWSQLFIAVAAVVAVARGTKQ